MNGQSTNGAFERIQANLLHWQPHDGGGFTLTGWCHLIQLPDGTIGTPVEPFARRVFTPYAPWGLMGIIHHVSDERVNVAAVDWPTGSAFDAEIFGDYLRLYVWHGANPELLFRLVNNMKRHIDAGATLIAGDGTVLL